MDSFPGFCAGPLLASVILCHFISLYLGNAVRQRVLPKILFLHIGCAKLLKNKLGIRIFSLFWVQHFYMVVDILTL